MYKYAQGDNNQIKNRELQISVFVTFLKIFGKSCKLHIGLMARVFIHKWGMYEDILYLVISACPFRRECPL